MTERVCGPYHKLVGCPTCGLLMVIEHHAALVAAAREAIRAHTLAEDTYAAWCLGGERAPRLAQLQAQEEARNAAIKALREALGES